MHMPFHLFCRASVHLGSGYSAGPGHIVPKGHSAELIKYVHVITNYSTSYNWSIGYLIDY